MKFVILNQGIGPHQAAFADEVFKILGNNFVFIEFGGKKLQYGSADNIIQGVDYYKERPYILRMNESDDNRKRAIELIEKADALRTGGEPLEMTRQRIIDGKLTFRSSERIFKMPIWRYRPNYLWYLYKMFALPSNPNYRFLCQSAYLSQDLKPFVDIERKCYKFAYFTQIPQLKIDDVIRNKKHDKIQIVYCSRFIDWKHPELAIALAENLLKSGRPNFEIKMIGANTTPLWKEMKSLIEKKSLQNHVILTGGISNTEVLSTMRGSNIFIFTSDRNEGWGAVLNEAMGTGCACVASHEIGSVPYLLRHQENGLIFESRSVDSLFENVIKLYDNPTLCEQYGKRAYETITTDWSAKLAAERLVSLSESILLGKEIEFTDGPCSKALPFNHKELL